MDKINEFLIKYHEIYFTVKRVKMTTSFLNKFIDIVCAKHGTSSLHSGILILIDNNISGDYEFEYKQELR